MIIQTDTREQQNQRVLRWFDEHGIRTIRSKLYVGDYARLDNQTVVVDRKKGMSEVYGNIVQQHSRFIGECQRAKDAGIRLIFLIEEENIRSVEEVKDWRNPRFYIWQRKKPPKGHPPMSSSALMKAMVTISEAYGIQWRFSTREKFAEIIIKILESEENGNQRDGAG